MVNDKIMSKVVPLCFSPKIFNLWEQVPPTVRCTDHCVDCMPSYQLRMKKLGRCEHPETMFAIDADGGIVGHRS